MWKKQIMSPRENAAEIQQKSGFLGAGGCPGPRDCVSGETGEKGEQGERDRRKERREGRERWRAERQAWGGRAEELGAGRGGSERE